MTCECDREEDVLDAVTSAAGRIGAPPICAATSHHVRCAEDLVDVASVRSITSGHGATPVCRHRASSGGGRSCAPARMRRAAPRGRSGSSKASPPPSAYGWW